MKTSTLSNLSLDTFSFLDTLPKELTLHALGFLDVESISQVARTSRLFRDTVFSYEANELWLSQSRSRWGEHIDRDTYLIDKLDVPKALAENEMNLPLLLSMTPKTLPSQLDETRNMVASDLIKVEKDETTGDCSVRYEGEVGGQDVHSIRSDNPLPRPRLGKTLRRKCFPFSKKKIQWNPFVAPYMEKDNAMNVTPRVVSYFEVSIAKSTIEQRPRFSVDEEERQACIAVGLATKMFDCKSVLPGHDFSFAYHSDNGGIYHGAGYKESRAAPFGPGDIVGCGVDYVTGSIFFTRNSKFLGYGWEGMNREFLAQTDLYPVLGLDSEDSISLNYGHKPFQFDLSGYCKRHSKLLSARYHF